MKGRVTRGAVALFPGLVVGVAVALCCLGTVSAGSEKSLRGEHGPEVAAPLPQVRDAVAPETAEDEGGEARRPLQGTGQQSVSRRRSSSLGLFSKRLGQGPKLVLTVSMVLGAVLLMSRLGGVLMKCLSEVGGLETQEGSTQRSLSSSLSENGACAELLKDLSESEGRGKGGDRLASLFPSGSLPGAIPGRMLVMMVLMSLMAMALATPAPLTAGLDGAVDGSGSDTEDGEDDSDWDAFDFGSGDPPLLFQNVSRESMPTEDNTPPPVKNDGTNVTVGEDWKNENGTSKAGSRGGIVNLSYLGKNFKIHLSNNTEQALNQDGLLEKVKSVLSTAPKWIGDVLTWGVKSNGTVLAYDDANDTSVPFQLYLPNGSFGIQEEGYIPRDDARQGWFDLALEAYYTLYVGKFNTTPTTPPPEVPLTTLSPKTANTPSPTKFAEALIRLLKAVVELWSLQPQSS